MPRAFSNKIFDRPIASWGASESLTRAVDDLDLWASGNVDFRTAIGVNLEHDWRVPRARVQKMWAKDPAPKPDGDLDQRIKDYVAEQNKSGLSFLRLENECNHENLMHPSTELFSVKRLANFPEMRRSALAKSGVVIDGGANDATILQALQELFPPGKPFDATLTGKQKLFLEEVFSPKYLSKWTVWVTLHDEFEDRIIDGPEAWVAAVGVRIDRQAQKPGDPILPQLFFALKYNKDDRTLARPSAFEVHDYPEHFPNPPPPPQVPRCFGHPIGLDDVEIGRPLLKEYIHADFVRHPDMVVGWGWTSDKSTQLDLGDARKKHHTRLEVPYPNVAAWMVEPI